MKKRLIQFALVLSLMTLLSVAARAAETDSGFRNIVVEEGYQDTLTLTPLSASNVEVRANAESGDYAGAVKMEAVYTGQQSGSEYLLFVMTGNERTPTADNLAYIDQKTAGSEDLVFEIYPKKPADDAESVQYDIWMSSNTDPASGGTGVTSYVKVASFEYYAAPKAPDVMMGDVNENEEIDGGDASMILEHVVELRELTGNPAAAADVNKNSEIDGGDASMILEFVVELRDSFD